MTVFLLSERKSIISTREYEKPTFADFIESNAEWIIPVAFVIILLSIALIYFIVLRRKESLKKLKHEVICYDKSYQVLHGKHFDPETPVRNGYRFVGWYKDKQCTKRWYKNDIVKHDMELYPLWDKEGE